MKQMRIFQGFLVGAFALYLAAFSAAQRIPTLEGQQPPPSQEPDQEKPVTTLKTNVNVTQLFFTVKDKKGALIPSLTKDDFDVFENGKPETIKYFSAEANLPLTLGILIDSSGSQRQVLGMEQEVGGAFLSEILREKDQAFVLGFDVNIDLLQDFTNSVRALKAAMNKVKINTGGGVASNIPGVGQGPFPTSNTPRGTLLYDAIYLAGHDQLSQQVGRKAMIILTDGEDQGSQLKIKDAIEAAQKADSIVYVLLIADRGGMWNGFGEGAMKKLASETGGRVIDIGNKMNKLKDAFDQIALELRNQYSLGYTPTNAQSDGTYRKVEIHSKQDYKVQARSGYYATAHQD
jgi:VWFA-related protein